MSNTFWLLAELTVHGLFNVSLEKIALKLALKSGKPVPYHKFNFGHLAHFFLDQAKYFMLVEILLGPSPLLDFEAALLRDWA